MRAVMLGTAEERLGSGGSIRWSVCALLLAGCAPPPAAVERPVARPVASAAAVARPPASAGQGHSAPSPAPGPSAAPQPPPQAPGAPAPKAPSFVDYEGGVGPYPIAMRLKASGQAIEGAYQYFPRPQELRLRGQVGEMSQDGVNPLMPSSPAYACSFEERASSGQVTGTFEGTCLFQEDYKSPALPVLAHGTWSNDTSEHPFWLRALEPREIPLHARFRGLLLKQASKGKPACSPSLSFTTAKELPDGGTLLLYALGAACAPDPRWPEQPFLGVVDAKGGLAASIPLGEVNGDGDDLTPAFPTLVPGSTAVLVTRLSSGHGANAVSASDAWLFLVDAGARVTSALALPSSSHESCCVCFARDKSVRVHALDLDGTAPEELVVQVVETRSDPVDDPKAAKRTCRSAPPREALSAYRFNEKTRRYEPHGAAPAAPALKNLLAGKKPLATY